MSLFIIADTHFGHDNIKLYEPLRQSIDDEMMIDLWNSIVTDEDEVWHLGDFAFNRHSALKNILDFFHNPKKA